MKKIKLVGLRTLMGFLLLLSFQSKAQSYQITDLIDSIAYQGCDSTVNAKFTFGTLGNSNEQYQFGVLANTYTAGPIQLYVSWGDGSSNTYSGQTFGYGQPIQFNLPVKHTYFSYGHFQMIYTVVNPNNNTTATDTIMHFHGACHNYFQVQVQLDCDSNGVVDSTINNNVPIILNDNNGNIRQFTIMNNQGYLPNMIPGSYSVSVQQSWLTNNNFQVHYIFPQDLNMGAQNNQSTIQVRLNCDSSNNQNNSCVKGGVYCDQNGNGVLDSLDYALGNAHVTIQYQNSFYHGTTDPNGFYSIYFPNTNGNSVTVYLDSAWLAQNGHYSPNNSMVVSNPNCAQGTGSYNFFIECDSNTNTLTDCVAGKIFCDANQNGIKDPNEIGIPNAPIQIVGTNPNHIVTVYSDASGTFYYSGNNFNGGTVVVKVSQLWLQQQGYSVVQGIQTVSSNCMNAQPVYLSINCGGGTGCSDMTSAVLPWIGYFQNYTNYIKLSWGNNGPLAAGSYTLTLNFPVGVSPITSTFKYSNYVISGNSIIWTFNPSSTHYFNDDDVIAFFVPTGYPSGTPHIYSSVIQPTGNTVDCNPSNNNGSLLMILGNSYDPNDKSVNQPLYINPNTQQEFTYLIRFQNTGDAPAQDIYVLDTLSSNLDLSTMVVLENSHFMQLIDLGNGKMKFNFPGIWLPDSTNNEPESHGFVLYKIKEKASNGIGSVIENTAHIYFDFNPAIITNTTRNVNSSLGIEEKEKANLEVYPNPVGSELSIRSELPWKNGSVTDVEGRVIMNFAFEQQLNTSNLEAGVYFLNLSFDNHQEVVRFVKK
jgi:uncharacterized repeat protein (TIGR01451 family)